MMCFAYRFIVVLLAAVCAVLLISCSTREDALLRKLTEVCASGPLTQRQIDTVSRVLRELRSEVFDVNSPLLDSLYNKKVRVVLEQARTSKAALILACYESAWASSLRMIVDRDRTTSPLELGHAFRFNGDHNTARSLYTLVFSANDANRKANRFANIAMEYLHIGYIDEALGFAKKSDSLFAYSGDNEGRLWTARLIFMAEREKSPKRAVESVKRFNKILQGISVTSEILARSFQKDAVVTLMTMFHELIITDTTGHLAKIGFGDKYGLFTEVYHSMLRKNTPVWETHSHRYFRNDSLLMPLPIVRNINTFDGDLPFITSSLTTVSESALVAVTPIGDYVRIGSTWVHNGNASWNSDTRNHPYARAIIHHADIITGIVRTHDNAIIIASDHSITTYSPTGNDRYTATIVRQNSEKINSLTLYPSWKGAIIVLTQKHLQLRSLPGLLVLDEIPLASVSLPDSLSQISRVASEPELYALSNDIVFAKSQFGTLTISTDSLSKRLMVLPHTLGYDMHARGQMYQAEPANICLIEASRKQGALKINFGLNLARSVHEQRSRRLHLVRSQTLDVSAMVSGDRLDVIDQNGTRLHSFIHLPLPFDIDDAQPFVKYFIHRNRKSFALDVASGNTLRTIELNGPSVSSAFRFYPAPLVKAPITVPSTLDPSSPNEATGFPFVFHIVDNTVAARLAPLVKDTSSTIWDYSSPYGIDIIQTVAMTEDVSSVFITHPILGRQDTLSVVKSNTAATYEMVKHVGITTLVLGLVAGGVGFVRRRRERRRKLVESIRQQQVEALREDMHDVIGSRLVRIASLAQNAATDSNDEVLTRIHDMTLVAARSLRNLLALMADSTMTNEEYYGSLREYVAESCADARMDCTIHIDVDESITLDNTQRHELLMIISEMLTNTIRHARATDTSFSILVSKGQAHITWADDGTGIEPSVVRGNGLSNMKRRAARINAKLDCHTSPEEGTRYEIRVLGTGD